MAPGSQAVRLGQLDYCVRVMDLLDVGLLGSLDFALNFIQPNFYYKKHHP